MERPASGAGHYLRDLVGGANDGVITTMAVVFGAAGAGLSARVAIIMERGPTLLATAGLAAMTLAAIGAARARYVACPAWLCAAEVLAVGGSAAAVAYGVGVGIEKLLAA